ncbi:transposase [Desulfotalea psychrophila]|uniref:transposase n=1 Tax=Desulfotalea psychrophila TaxID=84980 RepID=UPI000674DE45|nr:transposase [Desulfotalea psychrophila]
MLKILSAVLVRTGLILYMKCLKNHPDAKKVVMDNLNAHASLYTAFPLDLTKKLADWLEIHHTPKHGSWLNIAEIELSILT